jgi:VanZ family protein
MRGVLQKADSKAAITPVSSARLVEYLVALAKRFPLYSSSKPRARDLMRTMMPPQWTLVWTVLCLLALAVLSWTPGSYMVRTGVLSTHQEHFLAYLLSALTISAAQGRGAPAAWPGFALVCYAGLLEVGQLYVPGRHPGITDFSASSLGALLGMVLASALARAALRPTA